MTPLERAPAPLAGGHELWLKREDAHELGAFKWRGALPALEQLRAAGADTVVTASTGNHGVATAWAAARLGLRAVVYVPEQASESKLALLLGAVTVVAVVLKKKRDQELDEALWEEPRSI